MHVPSIKNTKEIGIVSCTVLQGVSHIILLRCSGQLSSADGDSSITNKFTLEDLSLVVYQADILLVAVNKPVLTLEVVEVCQDHHHSK